MTDILLSCYFFIRDDSKIDGKLSGLLCSSKKRSTR